MACTEEIILEDDMLEPEREENENDSSSGQDTKSGISADLIRGHINTIILRTLYERDKYGYEIIEEIESKSHGQYSLKQPTLYSALKRLESQGYINAYWRNDEVSQGGRRKYYTLTDSGREITEKNQAEWEYSRTVIDNLISDRSFDFTQPPPSAVDFKILKNSTSRVPSYKDDAEETREVVFDEPEKDQIVEINRSDATEVVISENKTVEESPNIQPEQTDGEPVRRISVPETEEETPAVEEHVTKPDPESEQRRILHENYLKLISEPIKEIETVTETPYADNVDTEKLIYNNRPETERDYKNLINNLYIKTVKQEAPAPQPQPKPQTPVKSEPRYSFVETVRVEDATSKADEDGLSVGMSDGFNIEVRKKRCNLGSAMLKCSLIIGVIMLLEFALCLILRGSLGAAPGKKLSLAYPFVILAIDVAQILLFGTLYYAGVGKSTKTSASVYLPACIIINLIIVLIIVVVALLLSPNFAYAGDIMAKIFFPCLISLNITGFGLLLYLFSRR